MKRFGILLSLMFAMMVFACEKKEVSYSELGHEIGVKIKGTITSSSSIGAMQSYSEARINELARQELDKRGFAYPNGMQKTLFDAGLSEGLYGK